MASAKLHDNGALPVRGRNDGNSNGGGSFGPYPELIEIRLMPDRTIYDEASEVDAEDGTVIVRGPDAVDVRLTPDAAEETSTGLTRVQ